MKTRRRAREHPRLELSFLPPFRRLLLLLILLALPQPVQRAAQQESPELRRVARVDPLGDESVHVLREEPGSGQSEALEEKNEEEGAQELERGGLGARSIFATHYHELNALAGQLPNVANAQVLVQETGDALVFLHQVAPGGASRSYGIEAARLAGVPAAVVLRARQVLGRIEANSVVRVDQGDGELAA